MKRLIVNMFIAMAALLQLVALNSCSPDTPEEQPVGSMPKVSPYEVFGFKEDSYAENLWAVFHESYGNPPMDCYLIWNDIDGRMKESYLSGDNMYLGLHHNLFICKNTVMLSSAVVLKQKEVEYDVANRRFLRDDVLDFQPFSAFYEIPGDAIGVGSVLTQSRTSRQDLVPRINAMIDDGSIEQYRVDLGY